MTTKSDIDQLLDTLESCGRDLPAHMVRQLLRMVAERCDEMEERRLYDFMQWQARCGKIEDGLALINIENRLMAMEAQLKAVDDTEHLLASPRNAEALARSIKQVPVYPTVDDLLTDPKVRERYEQTLATLKQVDEDRRVTDKFYADYDARLKFIAEAVKQKNDRETLRRRAPSGEDEGSFW